MAKSYRYHVYKIRGQSTPPLPFLEQVRTATRGLSRRPHFTKPCSSACMTHLWPCSRSRLRVDGTDKGFPESWQMMLPGSRQVSCQPKGSRLMSVPSSPHAVEMNLSGSTNTAQLQDYSETECKALLASIISAIALRIRPVSGPAITDLG